MKRSEKEQIVAEVSEAVRKVSGMYLADFTGLTVQEATELRKEFRKSGIEYRVVKNTLVRKALQELTGFDSVIKTLVGPTGLVLSYADPIAPAKIIKRFSDKNNKLSLKVAVLEKQVYGGDRLDELSKLPSKEETLASIVGGIDSMLAGVPSVINALFRDLVSVVGEIEKKKAA